MGIAFEAVVIPHVLAETIGTTALCAVGQTVSSKSLVAILPSTGREMSRAAEIAIRFSQAGYRAAAIYYDDRCGTRHGVLFSGGTLVAEYGPETEEWVPLDDDGEPDLSVPPVSIADFGADEEGECVLSAIDQALCGLGADSQEARELLQAIAAA